jgi:uncharacterized membrane protein
VLSRKSGYLQVVKEERLLDLARKHDLVLRLYRRPGDFVVAGTPVLSATPAGKVDDAVSGQLERTFLLGRERTSEQDVEFGINQIVEVAVRALSPGFNDPFTAVTCADWLGDGLRRIAERDVRSPYRYDAAGRFRIVARIASFEGFVDAAFNQLRQHGARSVALATRLLDVIATLARSVRLEEHRAVLRGHVEMIHRDAAPCAPDPKDRGDLDARRATALTALRGPPERED